MPELMTADRLERRRDAIEADDDFAAATRYFDGAVLFEADAATCWVKIYAGELIDVRDHEPPFGSTFRLSADDEAWDRLLTNRDRNPFGEQLTTGAVTIAGNTLASTRAMDGLNAMIDVLRAEHAEASDGD